MLKNNFYPEKVLAKCVDKKIIATRLNLLLLYINRLFS